MIAPDNKQGNFIAFPVIAFVLTLPGLVFGTGPSLYMIIGILFNALPDVYPGFIYPYSFLLIESLIPAVLFLFLLSRYKRLKNKRNIVGLSNKIFIFQLIANILLLLTLM